MNVESVLQTAALRLDWLTLDDAGFLIELLNSPGWLRWIGDRQVHSAADAERYLREGPWAMRSQQGFALLRVSLRDSGQPIGLCGLIQRAHLAAPDIGFAFLPQFHGQGHARAAAEAVLDWARALGHPRVLAITLPDNAASIRLLEGIGLRRLDLLPANAAGESLLLLGTDPDD